VRSSIAFGSNVDEFVMWARLANLPPLTRRRQSERTEGF
jgi:hypothetical protein